MNIYGEWAHLRYIFCLIFVKMFTPRKKNAQLTELPNHTLLSPKIEGIRILENDSLTFSGKGVFREGGVGGDAPPRILTQMVN